MHRTSRLGIAVLALVGFALAGVPAQAGGITATRLIKQWDADHDGTLSLDEIKKAASARFDAFDRDHHAGLDRKELGATMSPKEFHQADVDNDGTLDKNEYMALVEQRFRAADRNGDGKLDKKELKSAAGRALLKLFGSRQGPIF